MKFANASDVHLVNENTYGVVNRVCFAIGKFTGIMTPEDLMVGLQYEFQQWYIWCSVIKSVAFAFIITSVSSFYGYRVTGGSLEVGKASTNAVVSCSALILFADMILTQLLMQ